MSNFVFGAVNDTDESLKSKSGGKFGLNQGNITKIEVLTNAGKDGADANAVDIFVQIGEREYRRRIYETTGAIFGKNNTKVNPGEEGYDDLYAADMTQKTAVITHVVKAVGVTTEQINSAFATPVSNFIEWANKMVSLVPADYQKRPVDVFLEYQWEIAEDQDRTYPELPKNMKGGRFLCPAVKPVGKWQEVINEEGLHYKDDAGNIHPFDRDATFMGGNKGKQQGVGASNNAASALDNATEPKKSTW